MRKEERIQGNGKEVTSAVTCYGYEKEGDRKTKVSHEAFAGYFEYIVMNISAGIDPAKKVLPQTIKALEKMMEAV